MGQPFSKRPMPNRPFDPIRLEILWRRMVSIVDEADASVSRTAFSSLLRDAHDYTCMFTDSRGQELVQGTFCTPGQAGAMALGVKEGRLTVKRGCRVDESESAKIFHEPLS